jgi:carbon monoxide dehydrogenase subunit G
MTLIADEEVTVRAPRDRIWPVFGDADLLGKVLPGCERLEATGDRSFSGVLATRLQFLTLRADVTASVVDADPPDRLRLELVGRPRGLAGGFRASIPITLDDAGDDTRVHYQLDLTTSGRLATFGAPILRDTFRKQVATLVANLERVLGQPDAIA